MGQNPAGFFFRFSWLFSFFMLILAYQAWKKKLCFTHRNLVIGLVLAWQLSTSIRSTIALLPNFNRLVSPVTSPDLPPSFVGAPGRCFLWLLQLLGQSKKSQKEKLIRIGWTAGFLALALILLKAGYLLSQVGITVLLYLLVLLVLNQKWSRLSVVILSVLTFFELGYNAYLSQVTLGYDSVHKFADAAVSVKRVTDKVQTDADEKFYRIATDFAYSRTVPSLVSYPGLSTFSSSLERSTMDHFAYMGDLGVNAATEYTNGTPLTDALYGVRYYMHAKEFDPKEMEAHPEKMYFYRFTNALTWDVTTQ